MIGTSAAVARVPLHTALHPGEDWSGAFRMLGINTQPTGPYSEHLHKVGLFDNEWSAEPRHSLLMEYCRAHCVCVCVCALCGLLLSISNQSNPTCFFFFLLCLFAYATKAFGIKLLIREYFFKDIASWQEKKDGVEVIHIPLKSLTSRGKPQLLGEVDPVLFKVWLRPLTEYPITVSVPQSYYPIGPIGCFQRHWQPTYFTIPVCCVLLEIHCKRRLSSSSEVFGIRHRRTV